MKNIFLLFRIVQWYFRFCGKKKHAPIFNSQCEGQTQNNKKRKNKKKRNETKKKTEKEKKRNEIEITDFEIKQNC